MYMRAAGVIAALAIGFAAGAAGAQPAAPAASGGMGGYVTGLIEKACIPLIKGQDVKAVIKDAGLKRTEDALLLQLPGVQKVLLTPPSPANPTVCSMELTYDVGQTQALADALTAWAAAQNPPIPVLAAASSSSPGVTGWSWALDNGQLQEGLVFNARRSPDGKPLGHNADVGSVLFSRHGG
jgi:hypothetical protein